MNPSNNLGPLLNKIKSYAVQKRLNTFAYIAQKKANFFARPIVAVVAPRLRHLLSADNIENMRDRYDTSYHWVMGTEVTEAQDQTRFLESRLNLNRKDMRESRNQLDTVVERLRSITSELESTARGDLKHLHLRQREYDTIQDERKLGKIVLKAEFQERETFSLLMNAIREAHETERNYNQRIKMISMIGAILGPLCGYLVSARLNAMRFARMDDVINQKLNLLSFSTINAIREIHGLDPNVVSEQEKLGVIKRILELYQYTVCTIKEYLWTLKDYILQQSSATLNNGTIAVQTSRPDMKDISTQVTAIVPPTVEKVIVDKILSEPAPRINYSELDEFKSLMTGLQTIEKNQADLKRLMIKSHELQDLNKIEVSVNASDDEIIQMLQSDQKNVRELLISINGLVNTSQGTFDKSLATLAGNVESLSKKITNNSELYVANLEHSKIINDIAMSLMDVKGNIDTIETYYINDVNKQFLELTKIHGDLSGQILHVREDIASYKDTLLTINQQLLSADDRQGEAKCKMDKMFDDLTGILSEIKSDTAVAVVADKIDQVSNTIADIKTVVHDACSANKDNIGSLQDDISRHIDKVMQKIEEAIVFGKQIPSDAVESIFSEILSKSAVCPVEEAESVSSEWVGFPGATIALADKHAQTSEVISSALDREGFQQDAELLVGNTAHTNQEISSTGEEVCPSEVCPSEVFPSEVPAAEADTADNSVVSSSPDEIGEMTIEEELIGYPGSEDEKVVPAGVAYGTFVIVVTLLMLVFK